MILPLIGLTPKSDELIEDFPVEFSTSIKGKVSNGVKCQLACRADEHDGNNVPVQIPIII